MVKSFFRLIEYVIHRRGLGGLVLGVFAITHVTPLFAVNSELIEKKIDAIIRPLVDESQPKEKRYVGIVVGVLTPSVKAFYPFGETKLNSRQAPSSQSVFEIGSLTKVFTGVLLAKAVLQEKVRLQDILKECQPGETSSFCFQGKGITFEDLATHHSGFPRIPSNLPSTFAPYDTYTERDLNSFFADFKLTKAPEESFEYSNLGMGLLGHLLAKREQLSFHKLLTDRISNPLGLKDTVLNSTESQRARMVQGYLSGESISPWNMNDESVLAPAGGMRSTAEDLLKFVAANIGDVVNGSLSDAFALSHLPRQSCSEQLSMGLAWLLFPKSNFIWHNGSTFGNTSFIGFNKVRKVGVVILSNSTLMNEQGTGLDERMNNAAFSILEFLSKGDQVHD